MPAHLIAEEGPLSGLVLDLEEGTEWVVGRDPDASDFSLEDSTVSRRHARLNRTPEGIYLKNLSKVNPTLVNDEEHSGAVLLKEGDRVQIGATVFLFSEEAIPKKQGGYDAVFGDLEEPAAEPEMPPAPPKPEPTAYDTIFEDTHSDEAPFHFSAEAPLLLKVIAGPNAGAEIGIEKGRSYTIGKDPDHSDIVFQDLSVSRSHARLSVSESGEIEIEDLGSKNGTAVNGSLVSEKKKITSQDLIALGTTVFMIIDRDAPQETIYSPISASFEAPKAAEAVSVATDWKKEPIPARFLAIGAAAAAIVLVVFVSFFSLFKSQGLEIAVKSPDAQIKEALAKFAAVQFSYNPASGKLFLVGHVLTPVDYQEMHYRLDQMEYVLSVEDNVVIDEGVWKMMNDVISNNANWRSVSIHSPQAGKFVAVGYLPNAAESVAFSEYLTVNFPYLDLLENQVVIEENLNAQLQALIVAKNLGAVTVQLTNGNVVFTGRYADDREEEYKALLKEANALKGIASVKGYAAAVAPNQAGIDVSAQYQVTGSSTQMGHGFSVVMNGKIYTLGEMVDGMKITSIEPNTILLEKDGLKYKVDYTL